MLARLVLLFVVVPLIELYLLLQFARLTNVTTTIALVVVTGILGAFLARQQGWMALWRCRQAMMQGRLPTTEIADTVMIVFAAALLLTPGVLTDLLGFALLIPASRRRIRRWAFKRVGRKMHITFLGPGRPAPEPGETVEATFRRTETGSRNIGDK